jgi:hypothetical protein
MKESTSRTGTLFEVDFLRFWFAVICLFLGPQVSYRAEVERQLLDGTARRFERAWGEVKESVLPVLCPGGSSQRGVLQSRRGAEEVSSGR